MTNSDTSQQPDYQLIDSNESLKDFCTGISRNDYLIVDTEFLREKTYYPELCLVQLKQREHLACIDTLAINDLSPLQALMLDETITKVFHAASQDMEIFVMLFKQAPAPVFDTQIAAPLLGYQDQIGYGNLVKAVLDINLGKAHTRADWTRRPLPEQQLQYALDDVIHLENIYLNLRQRLDKKGRLHWLDGAFAELSEMSKYNRPAAQQWQRLRAATNMKGVQLATLQALAEWRELQARERNKPKNWVLKDDAITDLAKQRPTTLTELSHVRSVTKPIVDKLGDKLVAVIADAANREPESLPEFIRQEKPDTQTQVVIEAISAVVAAVAMDNDIHPSQIASRKDLHQCIVKGDSSPLGSWQRTLAGDAIVQFLQGDCLIGYDDGKITLMPRPV